MEDQARRVSVGGRKNKFHILRFHFIFKFEFEKILYFCINIFPISIERVYCRKAHIKGQKGQKWFDLIINGINAKRKIMQKVNEKTFSVSLYPLNSHIL